MRYGWQAFMSELPKGHVTGLTTFVTAGHDVLFEETEAKRCDVCDGSLETEPSDDEETGYGVGGRGLLVWARGDENRYQEPPLCATCAAAIGVSALQRWETEEDEG